MRLSVPGVRVPFLGNVLMVAVSIKTTEVCKTGHLLFLFLPVIAALELESREGPQVPGGIIKGRVMSQI